MGTDVYRAAFAAFRANEGLPLETAPIFTVADLEHAFYIGMARGVTQGVEQASYTIGSLADHNKKLARRVNELECFGIKGDSELIKTLLVRISKLEAKLGGQS